MEMISSENERSFKPSRLFFFILRGKTYFRVVKRITCVDTSSEIYSLKRYVITYLRIKE